MSPMEWWCGLVVFVGKNRLDQAEAFKQHSQSVFFFFFLILNCILKWVFLRVDPSFLNDCNAFVSVIQKNYKDREQDCCS